MARGPLVLISANIFITSHMMSVLVEAMLISSVSENRCFVAEKRNSTLAISSLFAWQCLLIKQISSNRQSD